MPIRLFKPLLRGMLPLLLLFSAVSSAAAAAEGSFASRTIAGRKYLKASDVARYFGMKLSGSAAINRYEMRGSAGSMVFTPQKRYGSFNGTVLTYSFPPVVQNGTLYISDSDFQYHLQPLLNTRSLRSTVVRTIMLDPGHGGSDRGAAGARLIEKDLTLQVVQRLRSALERMGYRVLLTRNSDRTLSLDQRSRMSNAAKADLFVSIHMNATTAGAVRGIETFALTPPGASSSGSETVLYNRYPGNAALLNSAALAMSVQRSLIRTTGAVDRGMKRARFVVLRETRCPAILVECGFVSNRSDESLLGSAAYRDKLAQALAQGIRNYHLRVRPK